MLQVVDDDSATLGLPCERKQWIAANHSDMCKFKSSSDHGYERVAGGIIDLVEDAVEAAARNNVPVDNWVNVDQQGQPIDMTSDLMKMAFGPFNKALRNPDEMFEKSDWGREAAARHDAMKLIETEKIKIVAYLFFRKFYPLSEAMANEALFASCLQVGDIHVARYLLQLGTDPNIERHGYPLLHMAIMTSCEPGAKVLLSNGTTNPNIAKESNGTTALMQATEKGSEKFVSMLIDAGADLNLQNYRGDTALMLAVQRGHVEIVSMLLRAGANPTLRNVYRESAAELAKFLDSRRGEKIIQMLIEYA